jgi:hypothetical protein
MNTMNNSVTKKIGVIKMIDRMNSEVVFVLTESNDDGYGVIGVYREYDTALKEKCAIIRDYYEISEDEIADDDLDDEIEGMNVYYDIVKRHLL